MEYYKNINDIDYSTLIERQAQKIDAIQDKLLQIDLENPLHDVFEALYLELGHSINEIAELKKMQEELERIREEQEAQRKELERYQEEKEAQRKELERYQEEKEAQRKELERYQEEQEAQRKVLERYQEEKEHLVSLLQYRDLENNELRNNLSQLSCWIDILQKDILMILSSRRWKIGNTIVTLAYRLTFKKKKVAKIDRMKDVFSQFETWKESSKKPKYKEKGLSRQDQDLKQLTRWINQLRKKIPRLLTSRRMKAGNLFAKIFLTPLGRGKKPVQLTIIENIFNNYKNWCPQHSDRDIRVLSKWIAKLERNYSSLINSKRWKVGNFMVSSLNFLLLRNKKNVVSQSIEEIFADFNKWKEGKTY